MADQMSMAEAFLPEGFGRNERLERIAGLLDWSPIEAIVVRVRSGGLGRPPWRPLVMVKALLLQQWYGLSDPGLEEALSDRVSFRRFCGLALDEGTPDETTLCRFRNALGKAGLGEALFGEVTRQLDHAGFMVKAGTLIDASPQVHTHCPARGEMFGGHEQYGTPPTSQVQDSLIPPKVQLVEQFGPDHELASQRGVKVERENCQDE